MKKESTSAAATAKKSYYPELQTTIRKDREEFNRTEGAERAVQLQETFFLNE